MRYSWADTQRALQRLKESELEGDPFDGIRLDFTNPVDGGSTLPTLGWHTQLLTSRQKTRAHRHNCTTLCYAFKGSGATVVGDERLEWTEGDIFVIPPWAWHHHENAIADDAILFSIDDAPAMASMGFYREEAGGR
jgi:gentisate 1,2-dioxygenase